MQVPLIGGPLDGSQITLSTAPLAVADATGAQLALTGWVGTNHVMVERPAGGWATPYDASGRPWPEQATYTLGRYYNTGSLAYTYTP